MFRAIVRAHGEPAPGPARLRLAPDPAVLAELPYYAFHRLGLERRRAELIRHCAALAPRLEGMTAQQTANAAGARARHRSLDGGRGDARRVSATPTRSASATTTSPAWWPGRWPASRKADDARMLELLEPYRGQRGRIQRLLEVSGIHPPKRGPRMAPRNIAGI